MEHLDPDEIVLIALGEPDERPAASGNKPSQDGLARNHLEVCEACQYELAQLTRTVELAREAGDLGLQTPVVLPPSVWSGIAEELGIGAQVSRDEPEREMPRQRPVGGQLQQVSDRPTRDFVEPPAARTIRRHLSWRRVLLVAAAVIVVGGAVASGVAIGRPARSVAAVQSEAALAPMPAAPSSAHGTATITQTAAGLTLTVAARQLPLRQGYYEVWLYDPSADEMVAVGTLGAGGDGVWTLASTIDLRSYSVVDVSAQDFDGNPAHKDSMLRGSLTQ